MKYEADKKHKKNPKSKKKPVNLITPAVIGIIVWFISSSYLDQYGLTFEDKKTIRQPQLSSESIVTKSYHLIGKNNVRLPPTDVFINLANF
jgi:hypothetical protein